jgi:pectate lyase
LRRKISMRRSVTICSVLMLMVMTAAMTAADSAAKPKWIKGWVSDSKCGVKGASAGHEACGKKCLAAGEHVAFVTEHDKKVLKVDNEDALKDLMGHRVAVKGTVDQASGTIHVDKVNKLPEKESSPSAGATQ